MPTGSFVAYYRVSTAKQGRSGLGLEAQRDSVYTFLNGGNWQLRAEYTEVESGGNDARPQLAKALAACRVYGATLVVAKLDRLSRDARFLMNLKGEGVRFVIAEMPEANELTVDLFAILAQHERRVISERTKAALAAAKRRANPPKLGGHIERISLAARRRGSQVAAKARGERASEYAAAFEPMLRDLIADGVTSANAIARALNDKAIPARRGGLWTHKQAARLLSRLSLS